jgi:hypothetical protein
MVQNTLVEFMQMKKAWKEAGVQLIQTKWNITMQIDPKIQS